MIRVTTRDLDTHALYVPDRQQNNAPQRRELGLSQENIVTGRRRRQAHFLKASLHLSEYFAFAALINLSNEATYHASQPTIKRDPARIHCDELPPPLCH
jgi:hypothetical protein